MYLAVMKTYVELCQSSTPPMTTINISLEQWYEEHAVISCLLEIICWSCYLYVLVCSLVMLSRLWTLIENLERNLFCVTKYFMLQYIPSRACLAHLCLFIFIEWWSDNMQYAWCESQPSPSIKPFPPVGWPHPCQLALEFHHNSILAARNYPFNCIHLPPSLSYYLKPTEPLQIMVKCWA